MKLIPREKSFIIYFIFIFWCFRDTRKINKLKFEIVVFLSRNFFLIYIFCYFDNILFIFVYLIYFIRYICIFLRIIFVVYFNIIGSVIIIATIIRIKLSNKRFSAIIYLILI